MTVFKPPKYDFYKILNVSRTATAHEIKQAYRKLAMALHPDKTGGDQDKAHIFKQASEAYNILSDHSKRSAYDRIASPKLKRKAPPKDYRKVYSPKAPPGFKIFNPERHQSMHYGDGMMQEEVERARKRYEAASKRFGSSYDYQSPLGPGFSFTSDQDTNPYSRKTTRQGPPPKYGDNIEYEEAHYYDLGSTDMTNARRVVSGHEWIRERMNERRKNRPPRPSSREEEATGCVVM